MNRFYVILTVILGIGLIVSLVAWNRAQRNLQRQSLELRNETESNRALKETLGELTVAITKKEKEIDQLRIS